MATVTQSPRWLVGLLAWADRHHPEAARQTRAVATRPPVFTRYVSRLFDVRVLWAAREVWPIWTPADRACHLARLDELAAAEMPEAQTGVAGVPRDPDCPGGNWLPTPDGPFQLIFRVYLPTDPAIYFGEYAPGAIKRVE